MAEGWAPLCGGEGLWLARFRDCGGLRLSLSPRLWLPLLRPLRLAPCRELERDLAWGKKDTSAVWIILTKKKKKKKKAPYRGGRVKPRSSVWWVSSPVSVPISGPVSVVGPRPCPIAPPSGPRPSPATGVWPRASPWPWARSWSPAVPPSTSVMPWAGRQARGGPRWGTGGRGGTGGRPSSPGQTETSRFSNKASPAPILPLYHFKDSYSRIY